MNDDVWKVIVFAFVCVPFAIWKWVEIIIWIVRHVRIGIV